MTGRHKGTVSGRRPAGRRCFWRPLLSAPVHPDRRACITARIPGNLFFIFGRTC